MNLFNLFDGDNKKINEYEEYFKKPVQEPKQPAEKRFHGHEEYAEYKKKQQEKKQDKEKDVAEQTVAYANPADAPNRPTKAEWAAVNAAWDKAYPTPQAQNQRQIELWGQKNPGVPAPTDLTGGSELQRQQQLQQIAQQKGMQENTGTLDSDDPWGPQGNFAGDRHIDVGGATLKNIQVGDVVRYFDQKVKVQGMSNDRKYSRITIQSGMGSITKDVLTKDLHQFGQGVAEQRIGPVTPVLSTQPTRTYPPQQVYVPQATTPKSPTTQSQPYGGPKPAAIIDIQNQPISETVGGLDLANAIFDALNQIAGDAVRQYGHEVVGNAIMDVVDEYGEVSSMSDLDMAVKDVLERLQKRNNGVSESRHYFKTIGTSTAELRNKFGLRKDNKGWFLSESNTNFKKLYLEATRTFTEYDLSQHTVSAATIGDDNFVSPVGSVPRGQQRIKKVKKNG